MDDVESSRDRAGPSSGAESALDAEAFGLVASDGQRIHVRRWSRDAPKACVCIAHGMAEHGGRYARLAGRLADVGYAVYASDHRGHGETAGRPEELGYFGDEGAWGRVVDDLFQVNREAAKRDPGLPIAMIGHSMGALLTQHYLAQHGDSVVGAILSGPAGTPGAMARAGLLLASAERLRIGPRGQSAVVQTSSIGAFNLQFRPNRTAADWLSSDEAEVDAYVADPLCGFALRLQSWIDMFHAAIEADRVDHMRRIPVGLPVLVLAGELDPVGNRTRGPKRIVERMREAGMRDVRSKFYPGMRHEIFNELRRAEVESDVCAFLDEVTARRA